VQEGNAAAIDCATEPGEERRQDRDGADHRDGDDDHRADGDRGEGLVAGEEHPGHRDQDGERDRRDYGALKVACERVVQVVFPGLLGPVSGLG
jgi:hypothetical protein